VLGAVDTVVYRKVVEMIRAFLLLVLLALTACAVPDCVTKVRREVARDSVRDTVHIRYRTITYCYDQ
jgi:hypothetical protein